MGNNYYKPKISGTSVEVRHDDVNGALRRLRKILEKENRQKDLARHEFYEKSSTTRNRAKQAAKKRTEKEIRKKQETGNWADSRNHNNLKYMKSKRKRRKILEQTELRNRRPKREDKS